MAAGDVPSDEPTLDTRPFLPHLPAYADRINMSGPQATPISADVSTKANHVVNVTGIEVSYEASQKSKRGKYPISIIIMIGGKITNESRKYRKHQEILWDLKKQFSSEVEFTVVIREHHTIKRRDRYVGTSVSVVDMIMKPVLVVDKLNGGEMSLIIHCDTTGPFVEFVRQLVEEAQDRLSSMKPFIEQLRKVCEALNIVVALSEPLGDVHPAAKAAVNAATLLYDKCKSMQKCHVAATELMESIANFIPFTEIPIERCKSPVTIQTAEYLLEAFGEISRTIIDSSIDGVLGFLLKDRLEEVNGHMEKFRRLKEIFDWCVKAEIWETVLRIETHTANLLLNLLRPVHSASYDNKMSCFEGTRKDTLAIIEQWYASDSRVFWLHGSKESGITAIAHTVSKLFEERFCLAGCFFFDGGSTERHSLERVIPTIAYQLVKRYRCYYSNIIDVLSGQRELNIHTSLDDQIDLLLKRPLAEVSEPSSAGHRPPPHSPLVIVLDAIEVFCDSEPMGNDRESSQNLMAGFLNGLANVVPWLKIFVSSGWNPSELDVVKESLKGTGYQQHDISDPFIDLYHDVLAYVGYYVEHDVRIAERDIYAKFKVPNLFKRIRRLPKHSSVSAGGCGEESNVDASEHVRMDRLFRIVILGVMHGWQNAESALPLAREILAVAYCIAISTPPTECLLMNFLQSLLPEVTLDVAHSAVSSLYPILTRDGDSLQTLFPPDRFLDFMADRNRSGSLAMDVKLVRNRMSRRCLDEMDIHLRFNICKLDLSHVPNEDVKDLTDRIESNIPEMLRYSCLHWMDLVIECGDAQGLSGAVTKILHSPKILFWLEVLSLIGRLEVFQEHLSKCIDFFKGHNNIQNAAKKFHHFVSSMYTALKFSTLHIYTSVLAWLPGDSSLTGLIPRFASNQPKVAFESYARQQTTGICIYSENSNITRAAFSPDGNKIVSGHNDGTLNVWDGRTGMRIHGPLKGHLYAVWCVTFSLDGSRIVSGSYDGTLRIWDALSGKLVSGPFRADSNTCAAALSPDGTRIVSGHEDGRIRIRTTETGDVIVKSSRQHFNCVRSIAYSPDGSRIVSGSDDKTLRIWDAKTGASIGNPLAGHTNSAREVVYSPDGGRIISSCSNKMVRIWDTRTGEQVGQPLQHNDWVRNVAYSRDGSRILSSSVDGSIYMWDADSGEPISKVRQNESRWDPEKRCFVSIPCWWPRGNALDARSLVYSANPLYIPSDGWIRTLDGGLLLWVPPDHRRCKCHATRYSTITQDEQDERILSSEWRRLVQGKDWAQEMGIDGKT